MKKILVTGTTGWLGAELAKTLAAASKKGGEDDDVVQVFGLARRPTDIEGVISIQADIASKSDMDKLCKDHSSSNNESTSKCKGNQQEEQQPFDVVIHLAGSAGWCSLEQGIDINVGGTRNLVDACRKAGTKKFIIASSVAVTGTMSPHHPPKSLPISTEDGFVGSEWAYGLSKHMVEDIIKFMGTTDKEGDYMLVRIGGVVTDPPGPLKHLETAVGEEVTIEPASISTNGPTNEIFPEFPLCAIALSDITECFRLAVTAPYKPGVRTITAVGPSAYSKDPVDKVISSWYHTDKAETMDLTHHQIPGNEFDPIYETESARKEIGFVAKIDLRKECLDR
mmetsp:Transcript_22296/g.31310  ORF Transcript_22296/g.31310 Transcript_22296/m.31310 type:complete len:338 (-) Transcript_22296:31-1044(-)